MTDRPIIFSSPMVRALLDGRKTQTRRLAWRDDCPGLEACMAPLEDCCCTKPSPWQRVRPGDRLWVRESFRIEQIIGRGKVSEVARYPEDGGPGSVRRDLDPMRYKPSIHMPRWASRLTLMVKAVKIDRLHNMIPEDAVAEGIDPKPHACGCEVCARAPLYCPATASAIVLAFADLWRELHGAASWDSDPAVVAISFSVERRNIDALETA